MLQSKANNCHKVHILFQIKHEVEISRLKKQLREKDNVIEEKLEELAEISDKVETYESVSYEQVFKVTTQIHCVDNTSFVLTGTLIVYSVNPLIILKAL